MASKSLQKKAAAIKVRMIRFGFSPQDINILEDAVTERSIDFRVSAIYMVMVDKLNQLFGFDQEQLIPLLESVDADIEPYISSMEAMKELADRIHNNTGIVMKLDSE